MARELRFLVGLRFNAHQGTTARIGLPVEAGALRVIPRDRFSSDNVQLSRRVTTFTIDRKRVDVRDVVAVCLCFDLMRRGASTRDVSTQTVQAKQSLANTLCVFGSAKAGIRGRVIGCKFKVKHGRTLTQRKEQRWR